MTENTQTVPPLDGDTSRTDGPDANAPTQRGRLTRPPPTPGVVAFAPPSASTRSKRQLPISASGNSLPGTSVPKRSVADHSPSSPVANRRASHARTGRAAAGLGSRSALAGPVRAASPVLRQPGAGTGSGTPPPPRVVDAQLLDDGRRSPNQKAGVSPQRVRPVDGHDDGDLARQIPVEGGEGNGPQRYPESDGGQEGSIATPPAFPPLSTGPIEGFSASADSAFVSALAIASDPPSQSEALRAIQLDSGV
jgi:hypothetical protein